MCVREKDKLRKIATHAGNRTGWNDIDIENNDDNKSNITDCYDDDKNNSIIITNKNM